jgi:hypothetical protein
MDNQNKRFFVSIFFSLLAVLSASAQIVSYTQQMGRTEYGIITTHKKFLTYKIDQVRGELEFSIKDENLQTEVSKKEKLGPRIYRFTYEEDGAYAYFFIAFSEGTGYKKMLVKISFHTGEISKYPISSNLLFPLAIRPIDGGIVMLGSVEDGDFLEIYNYEKQELYSITDFFAKQTRVWDMQVVNDQVDLLVFSYGKKRFQQLEIISYDKNAQRLLKIPVEVPRDRKMVLRRAQLLYGPYEEHTIVGTYSFKPGEWFSGYFHIQINELLEQSFTKYPFKELNGFYSYQKNSDKSRKHFSREMKLIEAVTDGEFITLAAQPVKTNRKFLHFITLNGEGEKVFDKSIKLYYTTAIYSGGYQLGNQASDVYFLFRGNENRKNPPGEKVYLLKDGDLKSVNQLSKLYKEDSYAQLLQDPRYRYWYGNKFLVFGIVSPEVAGTSEPLFVVEVIEV